MEPSSNLSPKPPSKFQPTKKWFKFFGLLVYFTILVILYWYYDLAFMGDAFGINLESIYKSFYTNLNPYSIGVTLFFPVVLAVAVEFSHIWAMVVGGSFLLITFLYPLLRGESIGSEGFGYLIFGIMIFAFWTVVVAHAGILIRILITKINPKILILIAILVVLVGIIVPTLHIQKYNDISIQGCVNNGQSSKAGSGLSKKCFEELAKINDSPSICFSYLNEPKVNNFFLKVNPQIHQDEAIRTCIDAYAKVKKDFTICDLKPEFANGCYYRYAYSATNVSQCSGIPDGDKEPNYNKQVCIAAIISKNKDYSLCPQITFPNFSYLCK